MDRTGVFLAEIRETFFQPCACVWNVLHDMRCKPKVGHTGTLKIGQYEKGLLYEGRSIINTRKDVGMVVGDSSEKSALFYRMFLVEEEHGQAFFDEVLPCTSLSEP